MYSIIDLLLVANLHYPDLIDLTFTIDDGTSEPLQRPFVILGAFHIISHLTMSTLLVNSIMKRNVAGIERTWTQLFQIHAPVLTSVMASNR
jgi:hypothetical protein